MALGDRFVLMDISDVPAAMEKWNKVAQAMRYLKTFSPLISLDRTLAILQIKPNVDEQLIPWLKDLPSGIILAVGDEEQAKTYIFNHFDEWFKLEEFYGWLRTGPISPRSTSLTTP